MTPDEMEAELHAVAATVARISDERAAERRARRIIGSASLGVGVLLAAVGFAMVVADLHHASPTAMPFVLTSLPLITFGGAMAGR